MRHELSTQGDTRREYKKLQVQKTTVVNKRLVKMDKTIADPEWKTTLEAKNKALEVALTNQSFTITTDRLHRTKLEKQIKTLDTKVDTMFTPLRDIFEYQNIIQQFDDPCETDKETAQYNSR